MRFKAVLKNGRIVEAEAKNKFRFSELLYAQGFKNEVKTIEEISPQLEVKK